MWMGGGRERPCIDGLYCEAEFKGWVLLPRQANNQLRWSETGVRWTAVQVGGTVCVNTYLHVAESRAKVDASMSVLTSL